MSEFGGRVTAADGGLPAGQRLESWKEIASYLRRDKRTVQRWEKEYGLPVHRLQLNTGSTVYAYTAELDAWYAERRPPNLGADVTTAEVEEPDDDPQVESDAQPDMDPNGPKELTADVITPNPRKAQGSEAPTPGQKEEPRRGVRLKIEIAVSLLAVSALVFAGREFIFPKPPSGKIRMVVLPLKNLSGDSQQDYFSAGLTDEMITQLGRLDAQRLGVIAPDSSKLLAGKSIAELGRSLDVQYALEGSVRHGGNQVRIDVQLVQVSDQTQLWADSYTGDVSDILRLQDEVAKAVAGQIRVALPVSAGVSSRTALASTRPVNAEAYDAYLQGRFYWTNRGDMPKSIEAYERAIQKDPQSALAYAGLASGYALLSQVPYGDARPDEAKPKARKAAERALQLDPMQAEAYAVLANVSFTYEWDFKTAEQEFQRAFALDPNNLTAHQWYAHYCMALNRMAQAEEENGRTLDLDPVSPLFNVVRAEILYHERKYDEAIVQAQHAIEQNPKYWPPYIWLGSAYREKKMYAEALDAFSRGRKLSGDYPVMIALQGHAMAVSGDAASGRKALRELQQLGGPRYISPLYFAAVYTGLGEKSNALDWLEKAFEERNDRLIYLGVDPISDPLRSEARFRDLVRRVGLPE
jgi:TolB-like protein/cytochrome c-type biogenesis protein CcmH/NrfG